MMKKKNLKSPNEKSIIPVKADKKISKSESLVDIKESAAEKKIEN